MPHDPLQQLRDIALDLAARAHCPYSGRPVAAVFLLEDGGWIPGVRVESASFSLTIPPLLNAWTTAAAVMRSDIRAVVLSRDFRPEELHFMSMEPLDGLRRFANDAFVWNDAVPRPTAAVLPFLGGETSLEPARAVALAADVAARALVPQSHFPVGCLLEIDGQGYIPGVNVEHDDWSRILCAERNALGTAVSYGLADRIRSLTLSCPLAPGATPCGACRQLLAELAVSATLWMDQGDRKPISSNPSDLLPGFFSGRSLPGTSDFLP